MRHSVTTPAAATNALAIAQPSGDAYRPAAVQARVLQAYSGPGRGGVLAPPAHQPCWRARFVGRHRRCTQPERQGDGLPSLSRGCPALDRDGPADRPAGCNHGGLSHRSISQLARGPQPKGLCSPGSTASGAMRAMRHSLRAVREHPASAARWPLGPRSQNWDDHRCASSAITDCFGTRRGANRWLCGAAEMASDRRLCLRCAALTGLNSPAMTPGELGTVSSTFKLFGRMALSPYVP